MSKIGTYQVSWKYDEQIISQSAMKAEVISQTNVETKIISLDTAIVVAKFLNFFLYDLPLLNKPISYISMHCTIKLLYLKFLAKVLMKKEGTRE